jgi:hypothetical protein
MSVKSLAVAVLAVSFGFLLGERFGQAPAVRAQAEAKVYIDSAESPGTLAATKIQGTQVVGFSCVEQPIGNGGSTRCYVASMK